MTDDQKLDLTWPDVMEAMKQEPVFQELALSIAKARRLEELKKELAWLETVEVSNG